MPRPDGALDLAPVFSDTSLFAASNGPSHLCYVLRLSLFCIRTQYNTLVFWVNICISIISSNRMATTLCRVLVPVVRPQSDYIGCCSECLRKSRVALNIGVTGHNLGGGTFPSLRFLGRVGTKLKPKNCLILSKKGNIWSKNVLIQGIKHELGLKQKSSRN